MTTITINKDINLAKTNFDNLEELQEAILLLNIQKDISKEHKDILDSRIKELEQNPNNFISLKELKRSIRRK